MANQKVKKISETPLWKLAIRLMIPVAIVLPILLTIAELLKSGNLNAITQSFNDGTWLTYGAFRVLGIIVYGFVMAFLTKKKAKNLV